MIKKSGLTALLGAVAAGLIMLTGSPAGAQDTLNCDSFASQAEAQATYNADPSDPNGLDADKDGLACEDHPYAGVTPLPAPGDEGVPAGPVETGFGGMAGDENTSKAPYYAAAGAGLALLSGVAVRRRRTAVR